MKNSMQLPDCTAALHGHAAAATRKFALHFQAASDMI
jgi:hypothetical protein